MGLGGFSANKFAVGKIVSENLPSENLLSEKPPDTDIDIDMI